MTSDNSPADIGGDPDAGGWSGGSVRPGVSAPTRCRSCGAAIRWITMGDSGQGMPVDARSELRVVERRPQQQGSLFGDAPVPRLAGYLVQTWRPHWETCPSAKEHRK